ncbi:MAG: aminodeoxychorismate/anthranilate synthase component II [Chryseobacterium sp.]|nr:MAG: aminodeoxychorismate/anthranilate synthase component II [Chryseobacterium sp.]
MKVAIIDNYDSFTYNLVQLTERVLGQQIDVFRNNLADLSVLEEYDKLILSPGPGVPSEAGELMAVIDNYKYTKSILGVCLGQQALAEACGAQLFNLKQIFHGVATDIEICSRQAVLFRDLPDKIAVGRYHSWAVNKEKFPQELQITAVDENGIIMALQHRFYDLHAVQFHPESILTPDGHRIIQNFIFN